MDPQYFLRVPLLLLLLVSISVPTLMQSGFIATAQVGDNSTRSNTDQGAPITKDAQANIPKYPVDSQGRQITSLPVYTYTNDGKLEVGLSWDPEVILTGKDISFFISFFDASNNRPHLLPYNFVIEQQDGKQVENIRSLTQLGGNVFHFVFANAGPIFVKVQSVGGTSAYAAFNTTVYNNPDLSSEAVSKAASAFLSSNKNANPTSISPIYLIYGMIVAIPVAGVAVILLYKKGMI
jgi:hypothetical protein